LRSRSNVKYLGNLPPQGIRTVSYQATVGIIPYCYEDTSYSMPLKAFEYVACGLPVVSVPIHALLDNPQQFTIASDANEFAIKIQEVASTRWDAEALKQRLAIAAERDYDHNFEKLCQKIEALIFTNTLSSSRPYISVLRASDGRKAKWTQEINRVVDETALKLSSRPRLYRMIHLVYKYTIKRFIR